LSNVRALFKFAPNPYGGKEVDTTSNSGAWSGLSPFILGAEKYGARRFENLWQFSKVYPDQVSSNGEPTQDWYIWRYKGFTDTRAHRYPKGKGAIPLYSYWNGNKLRYIEARKTIYIPIYAELVQTTPSFSRLKWLHEQGFDLVLRDYDAYDHTLLGMTLRDVANNPNKKCGHAFVLCMILTGQLEECLF